MSEEQGTMREQEEVELLSNVDLFDSLSEEEIRVLIRQNKEASSSSSRRARCASTEQKAQESSP
jgi:hypothetical protein